MEPAVVITNAEAGSADRESLERALGVLRGHTSVEVEATNDPGELDGVLHRAGSRWIVVAGGDGSLHAVVAALHRRRELDQRTLGLLPLGTGNDFARTLGLPLDPEEAARALVSGTPAPMDLLVDDTGRVVVNHVHVGAGAIAAERGARWKERLGRVGLGRAGYPIGAALTSWRPPILRLRVEVDGEVVVDFDQQVLQVAIGNGASVGGGAELTPFADPGDGRLDVMISRATGPVSRMIYAARLAVGTHPSSVDVDYHRGRQVSVSGEAFWCSADGELDGPERHRLWRLEHAAYRLVRPRGAGPVGVGPADSADSAGEPTPL